MIDWTPSAIAIQLGSLPVYWYGIGYAVAILAAAWLINHEAKRRGEDTRIITNGLIIVAIAALAGGRAYHVIDQWALYKDDPIKVFLPPYTGLGIYGGIITGFVAIFLYTRWQKVSFLRWADLTAPAVLLAQAIARWGNFFNQELYGPPTNLPWGIAIQCEHRVAAYACPPGSDPAATLGQHFHPLFLYESVLSAIGVVVFLWAARRFQARFRDGDFIGFYLIWYGLERFFLEFLRSGWNWTVGGIATAQIFSLIAIGGGIVLIAALHLRPRRVEPTQPATTLPPV